jgi:FkbM family methyltransferase
MSQNHTRFLQAHGSRPDYGMQLEILVSLIYHDILSNLDPRNIIDIGANAGLHSMPLANIVRSKGGHLFSFEPLPGTFKELQRNLHSGIVDGLCTIHQLALGERTGKSLFVQNTSSPALSRVVSSLDTLSDSESIISIDITSLDEILGDIPVDFIKSDCESYDFLALRGGSKLISKYKPLIIFENPRQWGAKKHGYDSNDFFNFFAQAELLVFDLHGTLLTKDNWEDPDIGFEFVAINPHFTYFEGVLHSIFSFWKSLSERAVLTEWVQCVRACRDPYSYLDANKAGVQ